MKECVLLSLHLGESQDLLKIESIRLCWFMWIIPLDCFLKWILRMSLFGSGSLSSRLWSVHKTFTKSSIMAKFGENMQQSSVYRMMMQLFLRKRHSSCADWRNLRPLKMEDNVFYQLWLAWTKPYRCFFSLINQLTVLMTYQPCGKHMWASLLSSACVKAWVKLNCILCVSKTSQ